MENHKNKQSDFKRDNKVVEKNELARNTNGSMNVTELKIIRVLYSCIDTSNPRKDHSVYIKKQELMDFTGANGKGGFSYVKKTLDSYFTPIIIYDDEEGIKKVSLITSYQWTRKTDLVKVTFHEDIWKYLIVGKRFLEYEVDILKAMENKYSILIYEYLLSYTREFKEKKIYIRMDDLRRFTGTEKKYALFKDFEKNVLIPAREEINNAGGEFLITKYEKIKDGLGNEITEIVFYLRKRTSFDDTVDNVRYPDRLKEAI